MFGVTLTLAGLPEDADVAVVELGMRSKGKMQHLARMVRPTVRVILIVGFSHIEFLGSLQDVAEAKGELLADAMPGDICVLNADDPLVMGILVPPGVEKVRITIIIVICCRDLFLFLSFPFHLCKASPGF